MKLFYIIILSFTILSCNRKVIIKNPVYNDYVITVQQIKFISNDKIYNAIKFLEENGNFYFRLSSDIIEDEFKDKTWISFENPDTQYLIKYNLVERIDTIYNSFFNVIDNITLTDTIINEVYYSNNNFVKLIEYSYLFNLLEGMKTNDNDFKIRLINPLDYGKNEVTAKSEHSNLLAGQFYPVKNYKDYELIEIIKDKSLKILKTHLVSNEHGIEFTSLEYTELNKKDIKRLNKYINDFPLNEVVQCMVPGNPWMLEYFINGKKGYYICSDYCLRNNRKLIEEVRLNYLILSISRNY